MSEKRRPESDEGRDRASKQDDDAKRDEQLDEELDESFPASDPPSSTQEQK